MVFNAYAVELAQTAVRYDAVREGMYEWVSRRRGSGCAVVAVTHKMAKLIFFILSRDEPYKDTNKVLIDRNFKRVS